MVFDYTLRKWKLWQGKLVEEDAEILTFASCSRMILRGSLNHQIMLSSGLIPSTELDVTREAAVNHDYLDIQ
jgi:hypothetical protein